MAAVAYIRRSASGEAQASEEMQRTTVTRLAAQRGDVIAEVYRDWGRSGGSEDRPGYLAMMAAAESGRVSTIYAYDQDRLARSNWLFAGLLRAADRHGFAIVTTAGELTADERRDFVEMRGVMDGGELRKITRRNKAVVARCRERGDTLGQPPLGWERAPREKGEPVRFVKTDPAAIEHVIESYRQAGTYIGTARVLNREGFPTKLGGDWHPLTVKLLLQREAPELAAKVYQGRRRGPSGPPRYFAGKLLRCYCGGPMTPGHGGRNRSPLYFCQRGRRGLHAGQAGINESRLLPWIKAEAARARLPDRVIVDGAVYDDSADRARLEAARDLIGEDAYSAALERLEAARKAHGARLDELRDVPMDIDWEGWSVEAVNQVLRTYFHVIPLGEDLMPAWPADDSHWRLPPEYLDRG